MNILTPSQTGSLPGYLFHQPPCSKPFPHVVEIGDAWGKIGSGIGDERSAEITALGEYFERRHFYMEVASERRTTLDGVLEFDEVARFREAFLQTSRRAITPSQIDNHSFGMTKAYRTSDFSGCFVPTVMLSLTHIKGDPDNEIYPERDTCGCSFHVSSELSIFGAIKESLERQFLTRFWLTKICICKWSALELDNLLRGTASHGLLELLCKGGEVLALDISDERFPGKCIVLIYGSRNSSRHVQYCAGMAYANSLRDALEKSLLELWQTFRFMHLFGALKKDFTEIGDPYLKHFLSCNNFSTFEELAATAESSLQPQRQSFSTADMSANGLLRSLRELDIEGYLYSKKVMQSGNYYTFSKFVSPSLFLHMNNARGINLKNRYSDTFSGHINPVRRAFMVPFP